LTNLSKKACQSKLLENVVEFSYRYQRYKTNYSIAIGYSPIEIDLKPMSNFIRTTDKFIVLNNNTCAILLDCANDECGIKAANNLLTQFQGNAFDTPLYSAIVTASNYSSTEKMIQELFHLIDFAITNNTNQQVIEHTQII
jgi:hypothetical protein